MRALLVPRPLFEEMLGHLQRLLPAEGCGLFAGDRDDNGDGRVLSHYAVANIASDPDATYTMAPRQQVEAMVEMKKLGQELLAIYHSHPLSPAAPSAMDVARAAYPRVAHVITSFAPLEPETRAYAITNGRVIEVKVIILDIF